MSGRLCPKCGHFSLEFKPGYLNRKDCYVCSDCGEVVEIEGATVSLDEDTVHRFPSPDDIGTTDNLNKFMKGKKQ